MLQAGAAGAGGGIRSKANRRRAWQVSHDTHPDRTAEAGDASFKFLPYQLDARVVSSHGFHG